MGNNWIDAPKLVNAVSSELITGIQRDLPRLVRSGDIAMRLEVAVFSSPLHGNERESGWVIDPLSLSNGTKLRRLPLNVDIRDNTVSGECRRPMGVCTLRGRGIFINLKDLSYFFALPETIDYARSDGNSQLRGRLPQSARRANYANEDAAHEAARIIRSTRCSLAEAIRQSRSLVDAANREEASIDRGIRETFNLMYDLHGIPIPD